MKIKLLLKSKIVKIIIILTIFPNYFTSAKIDSGNSGGLAVAITDKNICALGINTWLSEGKYESLGIIQPFQRIKEVIDNENRFSF